ncbi:hypothetical protein WNY37_04730 [Henriciella sp. AS95]|uniref:cyanophycin synthetase n=1 Tax=Henriciella sp. AS95 TaxID=3135782 RepID=UPI003175DDBC
MSVQPVTRVWLRNKRRLLDAQAGLARRRFRRIRNAFYTSLWSEAAEQVGATLSRCPNGLVRISQGQRSTFVDHSDLMLDSAITLRLMANKAMTFDLMSGTDLRTPAFAKFTLSTIEKAEAFLESQAGPVVVVKPADGTGGGRGVTTGINSLQALHAAARHAAGFNQALMVEEQLTGASFRLLYFDGDFIDAVRRDSPVVVGDGHSSVAGLVKAENERRLNADPITALSPLILDQESRNTLAAAGRNASYVPAKVESVQVKLAVNENGAAQNHVVRDDVHPSIIEAGAKLVKSFGIRFAGLDVTASDISAPLEQGDTIFNEVNVNPGIHHHYLVSDRDQQVGLAPLLLTRMFETGAGTITI